MTPSQQFEKCNEIAEDVSEACEARYGRRESMSPVALWPLQKLVQWDESIQVVAKQQYSSDMVSAIIVATNHLLFRYPVVGQVEESAWLKDIRRVNLKVGLFSGKPGTLTVETVVKRMEFHNVDQGAGRALVDFLKRCISLQKSVQSAPVGARLNVRSSQKPARPASVETHPTFAMFVPNQCQEARDYMRPDTYLRRARS